MNNPNVCPNLGLKNDRVTYRLFANLEHNCYCRSKPEAISIDHQEKYCLSAHYIQCPVYGTNNQFNPLEMNEKQKTKRHFFRFTLRRSILLIYDFLFALLFLLMVVKGIGPFAPR